MSYQIICTACNEVESKSIIRCSRCSSGLEVKYTQVPSINTLEKAIFRRYQSFLPVKNRSFLQKYTSNPTPLVWIQKSKVLAKLEYVSATSSSKDREAFIEVAMANELSYEGVAVASTGNMGAAVAAMCSIFKYPCHVFVPADTSSNKINQIKKIGAIIHKVQGTYDDIVPIVMEFTEKNNLFLASLQAFRFDGYKTIAYELYEELGKKLLKNVIVPLGDGTTYVAIWKGFVELKLLGLIDEVPSMIGVQAKQSSPVSSAYLRGTRIKIVKNPSTIAKAIRIGNPFDGEYALRVAQLSKGAMFEYDDAQILHAYEKLLKLDINAEYASALTYCPVLYSEIENAVLIITGTGLKN